MCVPLLLDADGDDAGAVRLEAGVARADLDADAFFEKRRQFLVNHGVR